MKTQTGAARIVQALEEANVRCVFGLPGTQTLELFEALRKSRLRTVIATNELSAAFMAGGWARITGDPGVLLTIPGPGFTWALTGVAEARLDSVPLLHITGAPTNSPPNMRFRQQEIDQAGIAAPIVKSVVDADAHGDPGVSVLDALMLSKSGQPGPVLLQVSTRTLRTEYTAVPLQAKARRTAGSEQLDEVCARLRRARRPILMVGQGTNHHAELVRSLVERIGIPLLTTPSARGVIPETHPLNLGFDPFVADVHDINELIESADLVLTLACKLSHSGTSGFHMKLPADRLVHIDSSEDVIGANYPVSLGVVADAGDVLLALEAAPLEASAWTENELKVWRTRLLNRPTSSPEPRVTGSPTADARGFFEALRRGMPPESILVLDSGLHQILARRYYRVESACGLLTPTDLQSMGFAIPTAIGAAIAAPGRAVVAVVGDGGFAMTALELLSAIREGLGLVVVVFVDGAFGQIRLQQLVNYGVGHAVALQNPDLSLLAEALGCRYSLVADDNVEAVIRSAIASGGVTLVEVPVRDSIPIRKAKSVARARELTRRVGGPGLFRLLKTVFRRAQ